MGWGAAAYVGMDGPEGAEEGGKVRSPKVGDCTEAREEGFPVHLLEVTLADVLKEEGGSVSSSHRSYKYKLTKRTVRRSNLS